jgi:hypothetical protein
MAVAVLVLAVMRAFLPPAIAWFMAAWWTILPIDFDALYEVHIFVLIPLLITILIAVRGGRIYRGCALAGLLATGFLMRNEMLVATGMFALSVAAYEIWLYRHGRQTASLRTLLLSYGLPVLAVLVVTITLYQRATDRSVMDRMLARKHSLNICQIYAFGYQQRHDDWTSSPWTECQSLMQRQFGMPEPALVKAVIANPRAMIEHFTWNLTLIPNGIQMLLFNRMAGHVNPDYIPSVGGSAFAGICGVILLLILGSGGFQLFRRQRLLLEAEVVPRMWGWIVLACLSAVTVIVMLMQRPRPSYMFALGIAIRVFVGLCCWAILSSTSLLRTFRRIYPAFAVLLILIVPSYYAARPNPPQNSLATLYSRLRPFEFLFETPGVRFSANGWGPELCNYLGKRFDGCASVPYAQLKSGASTRMSLGEALNKQNVNVFYAEESVLADPAGREFVADPSSAGWKQIGFGDLPGRTWMLFKKASWRNDASSPFSEIAERGNGISLGNGWYDFEKFQGQTFRWMNNDAEIRVTDREEKPRSLVLDLEPGPGLAGQPLRLHVMANDKDLKTVEVAGRQSIKLDLAESLRKNQVTTLRLHVDGQGKPTSNDSRILNLRVFNIGRTAK